MLCITRIPNEEIRQEFSRNVRWSRHQETMQRLRECDQLFENTIFGNEEAVAAQIEKIHLEECAPIHYNREESLRSVIKLAYYTYRDHYLQFEELPAGEGYAAIVYLPQGADTAIRQIRRKQYPKVLEGFGSEILLVGISYEKATKPGGKKHFCKIEEA